MKRFISLTTAFLCVFAVICVIGCKKKSDIAPNNGGGTPTPAEVDYFVDVDFLPKIETDGGLAPRLMANYNDEVVMIELRPHADTLIETVLFLCPNNQACMLCGNDSRMIYAEYDMETNTTSNNILLVTQMADTALLLTKCVIDWNTNSITTGDMMVLPINNKITKNRYKGHDEDIRIQFYNNFVIPLSKELDKVQNAYDFFGSPAGSMIACINSIYSTAAPIILFSDEPELIVENMEYPTTMGVGQAAQVGILRLFPQNLSDMASRIIAGISWYLSGGNGSVNDYEGGLGGSNGIDWGSFFYQGYKTTTISQSTEPEPMYILSLNVSRITENSAYLDGHIYYNSGITPAEMGYVYKLDGGPENIVEDMDFHGMPINGLQKATKYTAYAYAKSIMGDRVISPAVTFWTLGFEAFPNSLTFPAEGDTKYVSLLYSEEDITDIELTSCPSWCNIEIDNLGLIAVTVGATEEPRNGTIIITGHSNALGSVTGNITVTQNGANQSGFFAGTPFYNYGWWITGGPYNHTWTYIRRNKENGTYYNETHTETEHYDDYGECGYFLNDSLHYPAAYMDGFIFKDNSIEIIDEGEIIHCLNGVAFNTNLIPYYSENNYEGEITVSGYFINNNTFCLKIQANYTHHTTGYPYGWINVRHTLEEVNVFSIDPNTNSLSLDADRSENWNAIDFSNNYTGLIKSDHVEEYHGTGGQWDYPYGKNNIVNQVNNTKNYKRFPTILKKKQESCKYYQVDAVMPEALISKFSLISDNFWNH